MSFVTSRNYVQQDSHHRNVTVRKRKNVPVTNSYIMKMWGSGSKFRVILSHDIKRM